MKGGEISLLKILLLIPDDDQYWLRYNEPQDEMNRDFLKQQKPEFQVFHYLPEAEWNSPNHLLFLYSGLKSICHNTW